MTNPNPPNTLDEANEAWLAVDYALKVARKSKSDKTLPRTKVMAESRKTQILAEVKKGLQEGLTQLRKSEQARRDGRWRKEHPEEAPQEQPNDQESS